MQITSLLTQVGGALLFLFIFWKRQKEDFSSEIIFKTASYIFFGILVGSIIAFNFLKSYWLWFSFMGGVVGLLAATMRLRTRVNEVFEAYVIGTLPWLGILFLYDSVIHSSLSSFLGFLVILHLIFISYYLDANYKHYSWYKSGRIGFSGLAVLGLVFLIRFGLALGRISVLSFVSNFEIILSGLGVLVSFLLLFRLGRSQK